MSFRGPLQRLRQKVAEGGVLIRQRDGSVRVFDTMTVFSEMFLAKMNLLRDTARDSEVLDALRNATPDSRREFEERFGPIAFTEYIIGAEWVEAKTLTQDGRVERVLYDGDSEEATLVREGLRAGTASEVPVELPRPPIAGRWINEPAEDLSESYGNPKALRT
jgi:hypothetical protein